MSDLMGKCEEVGKPFAGRRVEFEDTVKVRRG